MRIKNADAILKRPVNKLFWTEYTYDTSQADKARGQKLRRKAAVIGELKRKYGCNCVNIGREDESLKIVNLLVRFNKTQEIFSSVTRVLSILTTASNSASLGRVNSE